MTARLDPILRFLELGDQFQAIARATYLADERRRESDAEQQGEEGEERGRTTKGHAIVSLSPSYGVGSG